MIKSVTLSMQKMEFYNPKEKPSLGDIYLPTAIIEQYGNDGWQRIFSVLEYTFFPSPEYPGYLFCGINYFAVIRDGLIKVFNPEENFVVK